MIMIVKSSIIREKMGGKDMGIVGGKKWRSKNYVNIVVIGDSQKMTNTN